MPGYGDPLTDVDSRGNDQLVDGTDSNKVVKTEWQDDIDLWPGITHVHACVTHVHACAYLVLTPRPYSENDMLNYKALTATKTLLMVG